MVKTYHLWPSKVSKSLKNNIIYLIKYNTPVAKWHQYPIHTALQEVKQDKWNRTGHYLYFDVIAHTEGKKQCKISLPGISNNLTSPENGGIL